MSHGYPTERYVEALRDLEMLRVRPNEHPINHCKRMAQAFYEDTGLFAPNTPPPEGEEPDYIDMTTRLDAYHNWIENKYANARLLLGIK